MIGREWSDWWRAVKELLAGCLLTKRCLVCRREGSYLCAACRGRLEIKKTNQCPICLKQQVGGQVCQNCQGDSCLMVYG